MSVTHLNLSGNKIKQITDFAGFPGVRTFNIANHFSYLDLRD